MALRSKRNLKQRFEFEIYKSICKKNTPLYLKIKYLMLDVTNDHKHARLAALYCYKALRKCWRLLKWLRLYLPLSLFLFRHRKKEDVTIIMGIRDIADLDRIINCLESIRSQDYDQKLIAIIIVDYGSSRELTEKYRNICRKYNVDYIRVDNKNVWNKAHALNIAIKTVKTKYILSSDIDVIFERNYIRESVKELKRDPLQVMVSFVLFLPDILKDTKEYDLLKSMANNNRVGRQACTGMGINLALTYFYRKIRGYDERYKFGPGEDLDLIKRFSALGIKRKSIGDRTSCLHQYHPDSRNLKNLVGFDDQRNRNAVYFTYDDTIVRNKDGWGHSL